MLWALDQLSSTWYDYLSISQELSQQPMVISYCIWNIVHTQVIEVALLPPQPAVPSMRSSRLVKTWLKSNTCSDAFSIGSRRMLQQTCCVAFRARVTAAGTSKPSLATSASAKVLVKQLICSREGSKAKGGSKHCPPAKGITMILCLCLVLMTFASFKSGDHLP